VDSAAIYQAAYEVGLAAAGLDEQATSASFTKAVAALGSLTSLKSDSDSSKDIPLRDQSPDTSRTNSPASEPTNALDEPSLATDANIETSSNGSVTPRPAAQHLPHHEAMITCVPDNSGDGRMGMTSAPAPRLDEARWQFTAFTIHHPPDPFPLFAGLKIYRL
jgi:hypothetical protein